MAEKAKVRRPTMKQRRAVDNMLENGGIISKAMLDAGYSPATAKTPQKLTEQKGFLIALEEALPDGMLLGEHKKVLLQDKDLANKMKAIDVGYKLKKKYPTEDPETKNITFNVLVMPELAE